MHRTEKVVKEAMRLYPPAWSLARTAAKECEIGGHSLLTFPLAAGLGHASYRKGREGSDASLSASLESCPHRRRFLRHDRGDLAAGDDRAEVSTVHGSRPPRRSDAQHHPPAKERNQDGPPRKIGA